MFYKILETESFENPRQATLPVAIGYIYIGLHHVNLEYLDITDIDLKKNLYTFGTSNRFSIALFSSHGNYNSTIHAASTLSLSLLTIKIFKLFFHLS